MSKRIPQKLENDLANAPKFAPEKPGFHLEDRFAEESKMFNDIFGSITKRPDTSSAERINQTNDSYNSVLTSRVTSLEIENKELRRSVAKTTSKIQQLELRNNELEQMHQVFRKNDELLEMRKLRNQNHVLRKQISDMEIFLADYGLVWIGPSSTRISEHEDIDDEQEEADKNDYPFISYEAFSRKIEELNEIILSEPTKIVTTNTHHNSTARKAKFVHAHESVENIKITFYKNGLMVKNGPFRYNNSESYISFVTDIMDGYFPSEFRNTCPDGVLLILHDRHTDMYKNSVDNYGSGGNSKPLTKEQFLSKLPSSVISQRGEVVSIREAIGDRLSEEGARPGSEEREKEREKEKQLDGRLKRLLVGANANANGGNGSGSGGGGGDVQDEDGDKGGGKHNGDRTKNGTAVLSTAKEMAGNQNLKQCNYLHTALSQRVFSESEYGHNHQNDNSDSSSDMEKLSTVQIKWNKVVIILKTSASETIANIVVALHDQYISISPTSTSLSSGVDVGRKKRFELRSAYPPRVLQDSETLGDAGLVPNGTVHVHMLE